MSNTEKPRSHAFDILSINIPEGATVIVIQKGVLGAMANQLKKTPDSRKCGSILRKLGHELSYCGDVQYGKNTNTINTDQRITQ